MALHRTHLRCSRPGIWASSREDARDLPTLSWAPLTALVTVNVGILKVRVAEFRVSQKSTVDDHCRRQVPVRAQLRVYLDACEPGLVAHLPSRTEVHETVARSGSP